MRERVEDNTAVLCLLPILTAHHPLLAEAKDGNTTHTFLLVLRNKFCTPAVGVGQVAAPWLVEWTKVCVFVCRAFY